MEIMKYQDISKCIGKSVNRVTLYSMVCSESEAGKYSTPEELSVIKEYRALITEENRDVISNYIRLFNSNFKNNRMVSDNLKEFFGEDYINGQEDVMALKVSDNDLNVFIVKTSDFGSNLSYFKDEKSTNKITTEDIECILDGIDFLEKIIENPKDAKIFLENFYLEKNMPVNSNVKKIGVKF